MTHDSFNNITEKRLKEYIGIVKPADCIQEMKEIPSSCIDLIIADPPYNLSKGNPLKLDETNRLKGMGGNWNKVLANWDNMALKDYWRFTEAWLKEAKRILRPTGSIWVYGTYHNIGIINVLFQELGIEIINEVIWYKRNSFPNLRARRFTASHETILWGHAGGTKRQYTFNYNLLKNQSFPEDLLKKEGKQMRTVWDVPNNKKPEELKFGKHPTQKPVRIAERIILASSKPNDIVLIPFCGAGSECISAIRLGRRFIAFEIDKEYKNIADKRIEYELKKDKQTDQTHDIASN